MNRQQPSFHFCKVNPALKDWWYWIWPLKTFKYFELKRKTIKYALSCSDHFKVSDCIHCHSPLLLNLDFRFQIKIRIEESSLSHFLARSMAVIFEFSLAFHFQGWRQSVLFWQQCLFLGFFISDLQRWQKERILQFDSSHPPHFRKIVSRIWSKQSDF